MARIVSFPTLIRCSSSSSSSSNYKFPILQSSNFSTTKVPTSPPCHAMAIGIKMKNKKKKRSSSRRHHHHASSKSVVTPNPIIKASYHHHHHQWFTERTVKAVILSQKEAQTLGMNMVFTQHVLLGLIAEDKDPNGFLRSGITLDMARDTVSSIWQYHCHLDQDTHDHDNINMAASSSSSSLDPDHSNGSSTVKDDNNVLSAQDLSTCTGSGYVPLSHSTKRVLRAAVDYARDIHHNIVTPEHIFLALFTLDDLNAVRVLERMGADINDMVAQAISRLQGQMTKHTLPKRIHESNISFKPAAAWRSPMKTREKRALDLFCVDLTARAGDGLIDPVICRESEIERIVQIISRRTKNNPILLGSSGVGKTAIAEGLAIKIAHADVPFFLLGKRVMSLDIGLLVAGTKERGELEERVTSLLKEIKKSGDIILFIDEVHTLVGSGRVGQRVKQSGLDIADILKPPLSRGELQCIASTTLNEYRTKFENDKALARRFQPVIINEPNQEDSIKILLVLREKYEEHHKCRFTLEAIHTAVTLSARYIPDRYLPDKAIDLMDEAGSRASMKAFKQRGMKKTSILYHSPDEYWQEIRTVQIMHEAVLTSKLKFNGDINPPRGINKRRLEFLMSSTSDNGETVVVGPDDIEIVASQWTGIPHQHLTLDEQMLLLGLDDNLRRHIVGQDEAVRAISCAVKRSRLGLRNPNRPITTLLFCGPTGVGKTGLVKALATCYFGSEAAVIRMDMSLYMERHAVTKLIGSPPGYSGYGEGGTLTEAIRRRPFSILLLDSIEKAHPDIFNILLQLLEDGHISDSQGRRVSFRNSMVVMTSNIGSKTVLKDRRHGFTGFPTMDNKSNLYGMRTLVMEELKAYFRPELLNRIDEVVAFHPLEKFQVLQVLDLILQEVKNKLDSLEIGLEVSESVKEFIYKQKFSHSYGVQSLKRAVTSLIEDPLSEALLAGNYAPGDTVLIDLDYSKIPIVLNRKR